MALARTSVPCRRAATRLEDRKLDSAGIENEVAIAPGPAGAKTGLYLLEGPPCDEQRVA